MRFGYQEVGERVLRLSIAVHALLSRLRPGRPLERMQRAQGLVEYALILVLVAIVVIGVLATMGQRIQAAFNDIVANLNG